MASARNLIRLIGQGSVVFVWYPDRLLLTTSAYLDRQQAEERLAETE